MTSWTPHPQAKINKISTLFDSWALQLSHLQRAGVRFFPSPRSGACSTSCFSPLPFPPPKQNPSFPFPVRGLSTMSSLVERLRDRSKRPLYNEDESDDDDDIPLSQRMRKRKTEKPTREETSVIADNLNERLRRRSVTKPSYFEGESDDEDGIPISKTIGRSKSVKVENLNERLRHRSETKPSYVEGESDDEDEIPISKTSVRSNLVKQLEKITGDNESSKVENLTEGLRRKSETKPFYTEGKSNDEDEILVFKRRPKTVKQPEEITGDNTSSKVENSTERLGCRSETKPLYTEGKSDDENEILVFKRRPKTVKQPEERNNTSWKRLRCRSERKPLYDDESDDEDGIPIAATLSPTVDKQPAEKEDACHACGDSGNLIVCSTCTYSFHCKCLLLPLRTTRDVHWSCPECVNPLTKIDKILDSATPSSVEGKANGSVCGDKKMSLKQYLVKWKGLSYLHCTWVPEDEFRKAFNMHPGLKARLNHFKDKMESLNSSDEDFIAIRPEWTTVDRVLACRKNDNESEYYIKWKELGYDECSWEIKSDISAFQPAIERFHKIQSRGRKKSSGINKKLNPDMGDSKDNLKEFYQYEQTPEFLTGGTLHPYQLDGLNFLRYSWSKKTHVILADEMGLGKTVQSIAFLASLYEENLTPHLVVAPLSTLRNWEREFATWAPEMNVVMYCGSGPGRAVARQYEFFYPKEETKKKKRKRTFQNVKRSKQRRIKFDVLLTSYEMITQDSAFLKPIQWECMIVDEGHRLKNKASKLFLQLKLYSAKHRVLLTGTPLQNNLDELFMLMHFLDDGKFPSIEVFREEFKEINQEEQVARLHKMLAPHLLRRVKKDVMKDLPPKKEQILRVELSSKQKEYYKAILTRNYQILARRRGAQISLTNVVMELRKLCCHAYMLEGVEPLEEPSDANEGLRQLLEFSGKMQLLDKMMVKLKEGGHRVLVYSQFQGMLDLLEDYLRYKRWSYERIDGKINGAERQIRIDRFNAKDSTRFCFLLSTRAGGLGINLATADTVIIYDSDWNPHADLQAMARAHRLGQTNKVMIYRLITRGTIEERMMQLTKKKMVLEHLVVGRLKAQQSVNQEELDDIIRYGSKELFADDNDEDGKARQIHYDAAAIEKLLNRDQIAEEESAIDTEDADFLKAFKVANFEYIDEVEALAAKEELARKQSITEEPYPTNVDQSSYWDDLLKDRYEAHQVEEFATIGKRKRNQKQVVSGMNGDPAGMHDKSSEDEDYACEDDSSESETGLSGDDSGKRGRFSRKRAHAGYVESLPLMEGEGKSLKILGFNQIQRNVFLRTLMRFGFGDYDWKEFLPQLVGKTFSEVHEYGLLFMRHLDEGINDSPTFSDGVPKEGLRVEDVFVRLAQITLIKEKLQFLKDNRGARLFPEDIRECYPSLTGNSWKEEHDILLLEAIRKHGYTRWQSIADDTELALADVACLELNLPSASGPAEDVQMTNAANSHHSVNGSSETAKEAPLHPKGSNPYLNRDTQRRIVEFLRKRYLLLEKIMDLELCLNEDEIENTSVPTAHLNPDMELKVTETTSSAPSDINLLLRELPVLELVAPTVEYLLPDNRVNRLEVARLYNALCKVAETSASDAIKASLGDISASSTLSRKMCELEVLNEAVQRVLGAPDQSSAAKLSETENDNVGDGSLPCRSNENGHQL